MIPIEAIYTKFGFVSEAAQLLEMELGTLLLYSDAERKGLMKNPNPELAKKIYERVNKQTLGRLINNSKNKVESVEKLESQLLSALKERNRLFHSYFRQHNFRLRAKSDEGRIIMLKDLEKMHVIILDAYKAVMLISGIDLDKLAADKDTQHDQEFQDHVKI